MQRSTVLHWKWLERSHFLTAKNERKHSVTKISKSSCRCACTAVVNCGLELNYYYYYYINYLLNYYFHYHSIVKTATCRSIATPFGLLVSIIQVPQQLTDNNLYYYVERGTMRVKLFGSNQGKAVWFYKTGVLHWQVSETLG